MDALLCLPWSDPKGSSHSISERVVQSFIFCALFRAADKTVSRQQNCATYRLVTVIRTG
jgi:hypothetical protein